MSAKSSREIPAGKFKDGCLKFLDEVHKQGIPITVTKRGKPIVRIVPVKEDSGPASLVGTVLHEDEDIFSTGEVWEAEADA